MSLQILEVGEEKTPVIIIDGFVQYPDDLVDIAAAMAPFPGDTRSHYPGVRRHIQAEDRGADDYVQLVHRGIGPLMHQIFGVPRFRVTGASFSMVTQPPETIRLEQRVPHFDTVDPGGFAFLHYLSRTPQGGTAFYRHRRTGFERLSQDRLEPFIAALNEDIGHFGQPTGYVTDSTEAFERIMQVDGLYNRALIYPSALLHSGQIPSDFGFSADPRIGRLTANIFITADEG